MCYDHVVEIELTYPTDHALMCALQWFSGSSQGDHPSLPAEPGPLVTLDQAPAPRAVACPCPISADLPVVGVSQKRPAPLSRHDGPRVTMSSQRRPCLLWAFQVWRAQCCLSACWLGTFPCRRPWLAGVYWRAARRLCEQCRPVRGRDAVPATRSASVVGETAAPCGPRSWACPRSGCSGDWGSPAGCVRGGRGSPAVSLHAAALPSSLLLGALTCVCVSVAILPLVASVSPHFRFPRSKCLFQD